MEEPKIEIDEKTTGLNEYLSADVPVANRFGGKINKADRLGGGTIGKEGAIFMGSAQYRMDGKKIRTLINDGNTNRVLLGKDNNGNYGLFVSKEGFDVMSSYTGENLLSSSEDSDWKEFNPSNFTYSSATRVSVSNYTPADLFQVGDKLRLTQTTVKYFYIYAVGSNYIDISGGTDYTFVNAAVTAIATSRLSNPSGHPLVFTYTPTLTASGAMTIAFLLPALNRALYFKIDGSQMDVWGEVAVTLGGVVDEEIYFTLPFNLTNFGLAYQRKRPIVVQAGLTTEDSLGLQRVGFDTDKITVAAGFTSGAKTFTAGNCYTSVEAKVGI